MEQSKHYEQIGDTLRGEEATKAYRAAQNHLKSESPTYLEDVKRIQDKIIKRLEEE